jgi:hypothetical protein
MSTFSLASFGNNSWSEHAHSKREEHARFQVFTAGISWLFPPAGGARNGAWEGLYAGGQGGGAWGNNTSAVYSSVSPPAPSDIRLLYRYRYLWSDAVYVGVMAQEVASLRPDAVVRDSLDDYLRVDYSRLGLKLMTLPQWDAVSKGERL